jgi:hypothetical protein
MPLYLTGGLELCQTVGPMVGALVDRELGFGVRFFAQAACAHGRYFSIRGKFKL